MVATRMVRAQQSMGIDSQLLTEVDGSIGIKTVTRPRLFFSAVIDFFIVRRSLKNPLFSLYRTSRSLVTENLFECDDIVHLHWTPGIVDIEIIHQILNRTAGCVWTLHDMWAITGGCHHSVDCFQYSDECQSCPQVRKVFQKPVEKNFKIKKQTLFDAKNLRIVCPSSWLRDHADRSRIFGSSLVDVIYNPVPREYFSSFETLEPKTGNEDMVVCFIANDVNDPNKNLRQVVQAVNKANERLIDSPGRILLQVIGSGKVKTPSSYVQFVGQVNEAAVMAGLISSADLLINFSDSENFPNVIAESLACGTPVIGRNVGGIPELIRDGETGFLVTSISEVADYLVLLHDDRDKIKQMSKTSHLWALDNLGEKAIMEKYADLYLSLAN
jgi:glycosyltransferase involved in cell wall biosynthesis